MLVLVFVLVVVVVVVDREVSWVNAAVICRRASALSNAVMGMSPQSSTRRPWV